jgi:hypothetical protein
MLHSCLFDYPSYELFAFSKRAETMICGGAFMPTANLAHILHEGYSASTTEYETIICFNYGFQTAITR